MRPEDELEEDDIRLLSVDRVLFLPTGVQIRINFVGADVIHS
jgi:heme/copper-type cytochrome/quinol oxidase subunit 2